MDFRALRYFLSVAQFSSVTRAAQTLNVAQPALSRQIQKLEDELGVTLLDRHARGVELTKAGALLMQRTEHLFRFLHETALEVRSHAEILTGRVSIGVPPATGLMLVPALSRRFRVDLPHAALHVREGVGSSLVEWVMDRRIDLAVVHNPPPMPNLLIEPLITERMVLVTPPAGVATDWSVPDVRSISLRECAVLPLILPSHPHTNRLLLDNATMRGGTQLVPAMEVDSVAITKAMVAEGLGATILTYAAVHQDVAAGHVGFIPIEHPPLISVLVVATLKDRRAAPLLDRTALLVAETMSGIVRQGIWHGALPTSRILRDEMTL